MSCPTVRMCMYHVPCFPHCSEKDIGSPEIRVREVVNQHGDSGSVREASGPISRDPERKYF